MTIAFVCALISAISFGLVVLNQRRTIKRLERRWTRLQLALQIQRMKDV